jgi:hypothetical protein
MTVKAKPSARSGIDTTVSTPIIYVGTGEANQSSDSYYGAGLFEILNWGTTWIQIGDPTFTGMAFPSLAVIGAADPTVQNGKAHIFAGLFAGSTTTKEGVTTMLGPHVGSMGLWRSSDGGSTWSQYAATFFPPVSGFSSCSTYTLFNLGSGPSPAMSIALGSSNQKMLVSLLNCGVYRATDYPNFNSWTASVFKNRSGTTLNSSTFGRTSVAIAPNDATRAYAAVGDKAGKAYVGVFRSTDGGQTFLQTASTPMLTYNSQTFDGTNDNDTSLSGYNASLIVSPYAKANVVFGGVILYYSTDGGDTWAVQEQTHVDQHAFDVDPSSTSTNGAVINAGNDGGLYQFNLRTLPG